MRAQFLRQRRFGSQFWLGVKVIHTGVRAAACPLGSEKVRRRRADTYTKPCAWDGLPAQTEVSSGSFVQDQWIFEKFKESDSVGASP